MHNSHQDFERLPDETGAAGCDSQNSMVNMANPQEVRQSFHHHKHHRQHGHGDGHGDGHVEFDNPYGHHHEEKWACGGDNSKGQQDSAGLNGNPTSGDATTPGTSTESPNPEISTNPGTPTNPEIPTNPEAPSNPEISTNPGTPTNPEAPSNPEISSVVPTASVADLTQLSEQLLPIHSNGSYPSVADWEGLHSSNVQKAANAAQDGSNMVFFGDSITEAMGYNPGALQPFQQAFPADKPIGLGLGGDGTKQLLYRLNHGEMQGQPQTAVVMIGTNDIGSLSPDQIAANTAKIIESIQGRSPNTKVMLMGVLPRPESGDPGNVNVDATNEALSRLATASGSVQFANLRDSFVDASGSEIPELYNADRLHLSDAGYQAWAAGLKSAMDSAPQYRPAPAVGGNNNSESPQYYPAAPAVGGNTNLDSPQYQPTAPEVVGDSTSSNPPQVQPNAPEAGGSNTLTLDTANIRGVNLSGAEWGKNSPTDAQFWPTAEELDYYKSKGFNTFRLGISWEQFQPTLNGPLDQNEMARLDNFLQAADARGVKVLINMANFDRYTLNHGPGGQGVDHETNGTVVGQPGVPVSAMQDFWTKIVNHVDSNAAESRAVGGWDLTNEPFDVGGTWPATATAVDQAIRATGDNHTVVVEGDQWARDFTGLEGLAKLDKNVAFEAHSYWDDGSGGYANPNPPSDNPNIGVDNIRPFVEWLKQNDAKGFVGEWGVPTDNTAWNPAITNFIHFLNQNDMGNMVWAGGPGWQDNYTLNIGPTSDGRDRAILPTIMAANQEA
ncbi:MAG: cellulase family glycosylhydrolase [Candidatus Melainabacteria bacterium]|nr:cellulase family glycosylhydrolase [Candidatus Melainabacteria bacterium]